MYVLISSKDSKHFHVKNNTWEFCSELPIEIFLKEYHDVAVVQVDTEKKSLSERVYYIFSDICEESIVCGRKQGYLGSFTEPGIISNPKYITLKQHPIQRIKIKILASEFTEPTNADDTENLTLSLHFRSKEDVEKSNFPRYSQEGCV